MCSFEEFRRSVDPLTDRISQAQKFDLGAMDDAKWAIVEQVFRGNKEIMDSATRNRRTFEGDAPHAARHRSSDRPPLYSSLSVHRNTNIRNGLDREWLAL